jgi:uncharacterized membrane protein
MTAAIIIVTLVILALIMLWALKEVVVWAIMLGVCIWLAACGAEFLGQHFETGRIEAHKVVR